jgi:hypothetical protein
MEFHVYSGSITMLSIAMYITVCIHTEDIISLLLGTVCINTGHSPCLFKEGRDSIKNCVEGEKYHD